MPEGEAAASRRVRVAIVDDHPIVAAAIAAAADIDPTIEIVGVARSLASGLELVRASGDRAPDVVLCDLQLDTAADGLSVLDAAVAAGRRVIVLTSFDRPSFMRAAFERGAAGFIAKSADTSEIIDAVRRVTAGGTAFPSSLLDAARRAPRAPSDRERQVIDLLRDGASNDEIGARLDISSRTVESHLRRLFDRYATLSRTELVVLALREGWIADRGG